MKHRNHVLKTAGDTAKAHPWLSMGIVFTVSGAVLVSLVPPLILGTVIDKLVIESTVPLLLIFCYFGFIALSGVLLSLRESLLIVAGQKITHSLRSRLSEKLDRLSAGRLDQLEPGVVVAQFISDVNTVEVLFTSGIISMIADIFKLISILIIIWKKTTGLAVLLMIILPAIFLFTRIVQKRMLKAQLENRKAVSRVTNHVPESLRCIRMIHNLGKEQYMEDRYEKCLGRSYRAVEKNNFYDSVYSPVIIFINTLVVAAVMVLSSSGNRELLMFFGMSAGTAVAMINYIAQVFEPLENLGMEIQTIQSAVAGAKRINEFMNQPERQLNWNAAEVMSGNCSVEFRHVSFGYDDREILKNVNFHIKKGNQVTIMGRTGAGKSTIFKLILGLYRPDSGEVLVNGINAAMISDKLKRKLFGYVEQKFHPVKGTIMDQITLWDPSITEKKAFHAAELTGIHQVICNLEEGYETEFRPELFSQGQQQLLAITRAVAAEPDILLFDEITANLDADTEREVLRALKNVSEDRTVISISHRIYKEFQGTIISLT